MTSEYVGSLEGSLLAFFGNKLENFNLVQVSFPRQRTFPQERERKEISGDSDLELDHMS